MIDYKKAAEEVVNTWFKESPNAPIPLVDRIAQAIEKAVIRDRLTRVNVEIKKPMSTLEINGQDNTNTW